MFEAHVLYLLKRYLGEYVEGLSTEALRVSVWQGDVVLKDLKLKAEALNSLKLPVTVKAGFVGTITLKVPWKSLGKDPVVVLIDRVFVLAHPAPDGQTLQPEDREKLFQAKLQQIEERENATLDATNRFSKDGPAPTGTWLGNLIGTIIGNLKITISNVHIRYEDSVSNPGHPFCSGITLSKLAAVTVDESGKETFDTSAALDKLRKSLQLHRLALYHDSDSSPWKIDKKWEDLNPAEWSEIFQDGIDEIQPDSNSQWALNRTYLVSPINGVLKYHRLGKQERVGSDVPFEKASLVLADVSLTVTEAQYYDGIKLLETFSRFKTRVDVSHLRPSVPVLEDPRAWWRYAMLAGLRQKKLCYFVSWERIKHHCQLRRRYVQLYATFLQQSSNGDVSELRQIERTLDSKIIILWRLLAHAKVESVKSQEASRKNAASKKSWWPLGWYSSEESVSTEKPSPVDPQLGEEKEKLTKEEWQAINKLLSFQEEENSSFPSERGAQNIIKFLLEVSITKGAARIVSIDNVEVICGRFEDLFVETKLRPRSVECDVKLKSCGLSSPEGTISKCFLSEEKSNALVASFVHCPIGQDLDWKLSATIAPCHITVSMVTYERFLEFVKRSNAISPTIAMETATALQVKLEQVTRRAQEQLQLVLEEQSRFQLDIDLDAPKVWVPLNATQSSFGDRYFILDFGHFKLERADGQRDERQSLYSRFTVKGRDMAVFYSDSMSPDQSISSTEMASKATSSSLENNQSGQLYSFLDPCGMSLTLDQIKVFHPRYPSTRISVEVPNLGLHFSPERYRKISELLDILFYCSSETSNQDSNEFGRAELLPWYPADLTTNARILVWRGIGNSVAEWQPCHLALSGLYLYVLESEFSRTYQRCCSISGRYIFEVPPTSVGGSLYAIAVSSRGIDIQKALESTSTLIIEFQSDAEKAIWMKELVQVTYRASASPDMYIPGRSATSSPTGSPAKGSFSNLTSADFVLSGTVVETKLSIYGKLDRNSENAEEELILGLLGKVATVNLMRYTGDLTIKTKLHSLTIQDMLQTRLSKTPQYLAISVINEEELTTQTSSPMEKDSSNLVSSSLDEDSFKDALPEFTPTPTSQGGFGLPAGSEMNEVFYEATDDTSRTDFVVLSFFTRSPDYHLYDGIDTQMSIRMTTLEFYCNRPTVVAMIDFGLDVSMVNYGTNTTSSSTTNTTTTVIPSTPQSSKSTIKGLLGYGKGRVVFDLKMDVDQVSVFLNKEDGTQLAMFVQERFLFDLKVHPSSISINGTLGNTRICDMSLGPDHQWGWLCDTKKQGGESLIKFTFQSYSAEDDDYQGYDYSLTGQLSAVRIVFLYRFVQEFMSYFMELASPHTEEAIKLFDKVGGFKGLVQKYEIDGATAVKLDLSLDTPIIIVPKDSHSKDYMQLDLGKLKVKNRLSWHGDKDNDDHSAVHLDILHAEIDGINMAVGVDGILGKPMVRQGQNMHIEVRRSLRDVYRNVPTMSIEVQIGMLHGVMSDTEYTVISTCVTANLCEIPNIPPSFRENSQTSTKDSIKILADKVNHNSQQLLSKTVFVIGVDVGYALLELYNGPDAESPLAQIALEGIWVSYRTTSLLEMDLFISIPKFSILDIRPDTKPEMRLMLGSHSETSKPNPNPNNPDEMSHDSSLTNPCNLTMLIMDFRWRTTFNSFVIRIQQPRVLVMLDFLLEVVEYFVPSLGAITGREEASNPKNDPLTHSDDIIIQEPVYYQRENVVHLSPAKQLIVDGVGVDEFVYDGCGGVLSLSDEFDKRGQVCYGGTIIMIGAGKRLRFKNVKIENGALLKKCTYLNNGSSYSVASDDGVEISLLDSGPADMDEGEQGQFSNLGQEKGECEKKDGDVGTDAFSFNFEAQIVSPELTFYDSSKLLIDDSLNIEKLLRAKLDFSFMYVSKGLDVFSRLSIKDLSLESGSGLVILEPVDISGGFSSVKDRISLNATCTDVCIRLSLAVSSLLMKLHDQTVSALQFGNIDPLVACMSFERIWVEPKGDSLGYNLTFWRPQAPPNYAILGDCVTSKPVPPTKVCVAISNTYGRVRKATGFSLICTLSGSSMETDCSIWAPIPPAGYSAVGCVAHVGRLPPPNHLVYCLRSDLVTSSEFSDCIYYLSPQQGVSLNGFSIWRADNVLNSFHAHNSTKLPKKKALDLHQILLRNPNSFKSKIPDSSAVKSEPQTNQSSGSHKSGSGWDVVRSLSKSSSYYTSTPHFERMWWDKGSESGRKPVSIWRPVPRPGFAPLGDCILEGLEPPTLGLVFKSDPNSQFSARPKSYTKVAQIKKDTNALYFWYPLAPTGYAAVGCVVTRFDEEPKLDLICCPRIDLVSQGSVGEEPVSRSGSSKGSGCWSIWRVENQASTFLARPDLKRPAAKLAYSISDYVKPKARENVHAELKLGFLSVSILDSSSGTMTPLLDATVTNINFTSQGRYEAMGAVLLCSIAASTFNRQLEAWEPLVEPFDGIFKLETYDVSEHPPKVGKRVRIAAATPLNLNVTSANLETLIETWVSWNRQIELETLSSKKSEEAREKLKQNISSSFSAINEDDFQKVIIENKLGCDVYFKRVEEMDETIGLFSNESQVSLLMPPPRFTDKLNAVTKHAEARYYVAIQIFESEGLPITDDGNNDDYLCALRLLMDSNQTDQNSLFPQSARTRCVKPKKDEFDESHVAKWNELFIFEVPEKGLTHLEVEVTNLGSRAGKGDIIGAVSIPVGRNMGALKRASSIKVFHHAPDFHQATSYPLMTKGQKERKQCGKLVLSTCFIERNIQANSQSSKGPKSTETDVSFSIGLTSKGPWESFGSVLPLSTVPKSLDSNHFAFEVSMKNGRKHATLRALAVVSNDSDVKLELSLCPVGMVGSSQSSYELGSGSNLMVEEVFENQRYQPISGWGKIEPWKWSTRDFSHTSKEFFEPPLPSGWKWASGWRIEKSQFVDSDGWAYAPDFPTLKWPPNSAKSSSKSPLDFARRRRWNRTRQQISSKNTESDNNNNMRRIIGVVNPQSSMVLPWTSMIKGLDLCLQIRPFIDKSEKSQEQSYSWGQSLLLGSSSGSGSGSSSQSSNQQSAALRLSQLKERDTLFYSSSTAGVKQIFWYSTGVDASALHTELNEPVPDWTISVNSVFRLENKLPFEAEYAIWEKKNDGNLVERQHGIVASGGCAYVYSADIRKNIYFSMFVQGGWSLEKDVTMIWDPAGVNNASSFWMVQKPSKRKLRVSIERDTGRSDAAPKTVRIFVPYWIENDCSLPLSYRMVLVEPSENSDNDSLLLGRAVKSAKLALRYSSKALDRRASSSRRNVEVLESIEDSSNPKCVMLSPQDYLNRSGPFQSRSENVTPTKVGISVAVGNSNIFSPGVSLLELETKERIDIRAFGSDGTYYRLAAQLKMASDRTKVLHFLPRTLFINRTGKSIIVSQFETSSEMLLRPTDPPKQFKWQSHIRTELLKVRVDGYRWSIPFSIESDGLMCISLNSLTGNDKMFIRVQVRSSTKSSRFEVLFLLASISSPYRIENRSMFQPVRFRQVDGYDDSWQTLLPNSSTSFFWEDLSRPRLLELSIPFLSSPSKTFSLDESSDHLPSLSSVSSSSKKPLRVTVFKEGKTQIARITDFTPETGLNKSMRERGLSLISPIFQPSEVDYGRMAELGVESEFHVIFELAELGVSVVDHLPEEVVYLSVVNLLVSYSSGMGSGPSGISRFKVRMQWIQVDNQLPFSPMPVLFSPQKVENQLEYILKFSMTTQANNSLDLCVYPYIGVQAPENCSFLVNIHEPIIWRLHDMIQHANIGRLTNSQAAVSVDPIIKIGLLNISEIRFRVSMAMSPAQRPRGALGFWASLMTALGNMEHMPVRIAQRFRQEVSMRQSALTSTAVSSIQKDLLTQPLQLLSGVDILGNASSALSNMSKGMAALSMDKKFIMSRQKQDSKGVEDLGDVIREGGGALAKGFFRGVTGILTKPLEGAKATGVEGFVSGVGKGLIGAAAQPVSGVLDLLSKTTEGANAVKNKISAVIMAEEQLQRRRLPRVIGGDNLLRPFDEYKAAGQAILQLAECGTFLGQVDLFKVRGKFAFTDAYEDHFMLPKGKVLLITHRRVLLLQQPSTQKRLNPARDPCTVIWDVQWDDLMTMELQRGAKDHPGSLPSRLILYLKIKPSDSKESVRVIKCGPGSEQAAKVYVSVQRALSTYGSNSPKDMLRKKVTKPYTPQGVGSSSEVFPREIYGFWDGAPDRNKNLLDSSLLIIHGQPIPD